MRVRFFLVVCLCLGLVGADPFAEGSSNKSSTSKASGSTSKGSSAASGSGKTVHVKGYTKKNGTKVDAYDRKPPKSASKDAASTTSKTSRSTGSSSTRSTTSTATSSTVTRDSNGHIKRSPAAKHAF